MELLKLSSHLGTLKRRGLVRSALEEVPLSRMCLSYRRLTALSSGGTRGHLLKLRGVLLLGLGNTACALEDLAPFEACFLFWRM